MRPYISLSFFECRTDSLIIWHHCFNYKLYIPWNFMGKFKRMSRWGFGRRQAWYYLDIICCANLLGRFWIYCLSQDIANIIQCLWRHYRVLSHPHPHHGKRWFWNFGFSGRGIVPSGVWRHRDWYKNIDVSEELAASGCEIFGTFYKITRRHIPVASNRPWRPIGLWDVEAPTFSRQSAHRWRRGCQPYTRRPPFTPRKIPGTHFC
jgi:hypothetical protein